MDCHYCVTTEQIASCHWKQRQAHPEKKRINLTLVCIFRFKCTHSEGARLPMQITPAHCKRCQLASGCWGCWLLQGDISSIECNAPKTSLWLLWSLVALSLYSTWGLVCRHPPFTLRAAVKLEKM